MVTGLSAFNKKNQTILSGIVAILVILGAVWSACYAIYVVPRDYTIEQQKIKIADLKETIQSQDLRIEKLEREIDPNNKSHLLSKYSLKITNPKNGDKVSVSTIVTGTLLEELPEEQYMWVIINPHTSPRQWWPQEKRIEPNEHWSIPALVRDFSFMYINKEFDIAIVLVNKTDNQYYSDYIKKGVDTGLLLPESARIIDKVTVTNDGFI